MGTLDSRTTGPRPAAGERRVSETRSVSHEVVSAAASAVSDAILEKRPYLKYAFLNPYNLSLLIGALAAAGITLNPFLALIALGLEGLWLLHAPDSKRLRHILWDPRFEAVREALERQERERRMQSLGDRDRQRVERLVERQRDIRKLAEGNPSFTADLLKAELVKTDRLVTAFLDMAVTCGRYEEYLAGVDLEDLERERRRWETEVRGGHEGDAHTEIGRKNLDILLKRLDKLKEIRRYLGVARGQLDLIENSFQLLADQIVTMESPRELSGQLDELLDGVESIRESARDTERLMATLSV